MSKKNTEVDVSALQPDELSALKKEILEFVQRIETIDNEIDLLRQDRKELFEEAKEKIDVSTLVQVLKVLKIESNVKRKDTFDVMREALSDKTQ